jgi:glycosyltransferase involved in cell wall biosynthesis
MNTLVLAGDVPATATMPGSPRLLNLCRGLTARHRLRLATLSSSSERQQMFLSDSTATGIFETVQILPAPPSATPSWWNKQRHRWHAAAFVETRYLYPDYHRQLRSTIREMVADHAIDLVYVDSLAMTQYIGADLSVPAVVDLHDCSTLLLSRMIRLEPTLRRRLLLGVDRLGIARLERSLHASFRLVITNSEVDEQHLRAMSPAASTLTIGNGVDSDFFAPTADAGRPERLVFTGVMSYAPNEDAAIYFCDQILPSIRRRHPQVEFWIVGKDPSPGVRALSRHPGVHVTGGVPDIRPHLAEAGVFVCPLRYGAGIKNKILAALAMQRPVVATPISLDGLDLRDGHELRVGVDAADFADKVCELLRDTERARTLARAGHQLVTRKYSWHASAMLLRDALERVVA